MQFNIEKTVSNFVESQFPQFYLDEGPNFILFLKAYYEWMESEGQAINEARNIFDLRDIDNTVDSFLSHFQKKYLYGIPFNVIVNPRYLLKHILDVYRSKGSINAYKLLFRLIYNQDVEVYLPGNDLLKPSDGTWIRPQYIEVTNVPNLANYVGQTIIGVSSNTTAVIESSIEEPINQNIITSLYLSNILPTGGSFLEGEKVVVNGQQNNTAAITAAPIVTGSLDHLNIINGGQNFKVGDVLSIVQRDLSNNAVIAHGVDGAVRVTSTTASQGSLYFDLVSGGFGYNPSANIFIYNGANNPGTGGNFSIGSYSYLQTVTHNTDLIIDYWNLPINATSYGFPANSSVNATSGEIINALTYVNTVFGSVSSLTNIQTGNSYTQQPTIFIRSTENASNAMPGTITYSTTSNTLTLSGSYNITGNTTGNGFPYFFSANDVICLQANSANNLTVEYQVIKSVDSNTQLTLWGPPKFSSTASATYRPSVVVLPSNFALYEPIMFESDNSIVGENAIITASPSSGTGVVSSAVAINSGKGYIDGELVKLYLSNGLSNITILQGGIGYANNDALLFTGGSSLSQAIGYITTDSNGSITATTLTNSGSGYESLPYISVKSNFGSGAVLTSDIQAYNTVSQVQARVVKSGMGKKQGYWTTTRGFLDSDKYIQDSYFYQNFSYQIKAASTLDKYKNILYNTFHIAGNELFGEFHETLNQISQSSLLYSPTSAIIGS